MTNLLRLVDQLPSFSGVGIVSALLSRQNQRLGDFAAGAVVIHERALEAIQPTWSATEQPGTLSFRADRLAPEEFALVDTYLSRRDALTGDVRARMANQIVRRLASKFSLPPDARLSNQRLPEAIAKERRSTARYH